jgi:branched-chain amino acid transport system ATP-binding protein
MPLLELHNVTKRFGGLVAVDNVSFSIQKGEMVGIIGPNGAGKTTVFNLITGALKPDSGRIKIDGSDITNLKPHEICKRGVARTFQIVKPFHRMSALDNVITGALLRTKSVRVARDEAQKLLQFMGLEQKSDVIAKGLTIAEMKALEIARALATKPKLLLVDEVVAGLNPTEIDNTLMLLRKIRDELGVGVLSLVEHVMRAIMSISDRIIVFDRGVTIAEGKPEEIVKNAKVIEVYLGMAYA